jgi:2-hydroxychromene-2-carboxylate isomerase
MQVDWYFDFVSPYSYLQCERLAKFPATIREEALAAGAFGVPTLAIDGELFWGYDATDMALDYLRDPVGFISGEIRRVDQLPYGATRAIKDR